MIWLSSACPVAETSPSAREYAPRGRILNAIDISQIFPGQRAHLSIKAASHGRGNLKESGTLGWRMTWLNLRSATLQQFSLRGGTQVELLADF